MISVIIAEWLMIVVLFIITSIHDTREQGSKPPVSNLFHAFWSAVFFGFSAILYFTLCHYWTVFLYALCERFLFYNPMLNSWRKRKYFYLSINADHPAITDRILLALGWWYVPLYFFIFVLFIVANIYL